MCEACSQWTVYQPSVAPGAERSPSKYISIYSSCQVTAASCGTRDVEPVRELSASQQTYRPGDLFG